MASSPSVVLMAVPVELQAALANLLDSYQHTALPQHPADTDRLEQDLIAHTDALAAAMTQHVLQQALDQRSTSARHRRLFRPLFRLSPPLPKHFKNQGRRSVRVRLSRGGCICLRVPYFSRNCDASGPRTHKGCFPALQALGLLDQASPRLASLCAQAVAVAGSLQEAQQQLRQQGIALHLKTLCRLAYRVAARARTALRREGYRLPTQHRVTGRNVVIGLDGGRARLRKDNGKKTPKGRRCFDNPWREPKLLIIYVVDDQGRKVQTFPPILDGTFGDANALLRQLEGYLRSVQIAEAQHVCFTGDGADWIWNRVGALVKKLGLRAEQVHEVVDYYHAAEHVSKVLEAQQQQWRPGQRKWWRGRLLGLLRRGQIEALVTSLRGLKGKVACAEAKYFAKRTKRMQYEAVKQAGLPIGSGAIESAIRRVVNLRLKGPATYWKPEHAEHVLLLRAYAKSGRWEDLKALAFGMPGVAAEAACAKSLRLRKLRACGDER